MLLRARLAEALGHDRDALDDYKFAIEFARPASVGGSQAARGVLRQKRGEIEAGRALRELETLSAIWRGDAIEVKTLSKMVQIYADTGRYREAFAAARTATRLQPNSELSRQAQDLAAALFAELYLSPKGEDMPPVDALSCSTNTAS